MVGREDGLSYRGAASDVARVTAFAHEPRDIDAAHVVAGAEIRLAVPADVPAIARVIDRCFEPYVERLGVQPLPMEDDYAGRVARGEVWVADAMAGSPSPPVDGVIVCTFEDVYLLVVTLAVRPEVRRLGIGRSLMDFSAELARVRGLRTIRLYTNELMSESRAFYARLGFTEIGRETIEGRHAVWLRRGLG